ncbi:hypothetical protein L211DRAFT_847069 [Terfezia boudieri ATCC MYA-4762]|uniref:Uncharacterized protein n=1 Tax=Terfezia boudieri ATCC MYA-4762 TaxID=1051890 RepID=A0A3N4LXW1_9PEZI|nr:hypothetical protein L211DRAFT_847069 [Terfezia boudieri ATCC MYA-4762]
MSQPMKSFRSHRKIFTKGLETFTELSRAQAPLGLLTNLRDAYLVKLSTGILKGRSRRISAQGAHTSKLVQYCKVPLNVALKHLYMELTSAQSNPPESPFSEQAGSLIRVLQRHPRSVVAVFSRAEARIVARTTVDTRDCERNQITPISPGP